MKKKSNAGKPSPKRRMPKNPGQIRVKCREAEGCYNFAGPEPKRFYQLETLGSSVEGLLNQGDSWLMAVLRESTQGLAPLAVTMEMLWENPYAMAFRVGASVAQGRPGVILLVCAKNHQEHSVRLEGEIESIRTLSARPESGILPVRGEGTFYLPNKHQRADGKGRKVLAYARAWTGPFAATELRPSGQYVLVGKERRLLSVADSEAYGKALAVALLKALDPVSRNAPSLNSTHWGDVLCRVGRTGLTPALLHCPRVTRYRSIQAYLKGMLLWEPVPGSGVCPMQLVAPELLAEAIRETLDPVIAAESVRRLSGPGGESDVPEAYVESLRAAMME
ncbi:MAG: hypothetical protein RLZZ303_1704 [Candidatus Hydrogenedentota bacterium]|jgi:hypothetical protein